MAVLAISLTFAAVEGLEISPEDPWTVVAAWEQRIVQQLTGFGGLILQQSPSLLAAAFGGPRPLELLPQHAVQAALEVRRSVTEMTKSDARDAGVEVRMAVHTGIVLVDVPIRPPTARVLPMADALTLTLRLLGAAAPGEILLSPQVEHQVKEWYKLQAPPYPLVPWPGSPRSSPQSGSPACSWDTTSFYRDQRTPPSR